MSALKHWRFQRISAVLLVPLLGWLMLGLVNLDGFNSSTILGWLHGFWQPFLLWLMVTISFYHGGLGMEVIFEDYVSMIKARSLLTDLVKIGLFSSWLLFSIAIFNNWLGYF